MHLGARFFDSILSLWTASDTLVPSSANPQSLNRYAYAGNNPHRYIDPSGHCSTDDTNPDDPYTADLECWEAYWALLPKLGYWSRAYGPNGLDGWALPDLLGLTHFIDAYHIKFERGGQYIGGDWATDWNGDSLRAALMAFSRVEDFLGGNAGLSLSGLRMVRSDSMQTANGGGLYYPGADTLSVSRDFINHDVELEIECIVHELGHAADWNMGGGHNWSGQNQEWWSVAAGWHQLWFGDNVTWYQDVEHIKTAATIRQSNFPWEDFATTFTWMVEARYGSGVKDRNYKEPSRERQRALAVYFWTPSR